MLSSCESLCRPEVPGVLTARETFAYREQQPEECQSWKRDPRNLDECISQDTRHSFHGPRSKQSRESGQPPQLRSRCNSCARRTFYHSSSSSASSPGRDGHRVQQDTVRGRPDISGIIRQAHRGEIRTGRAQVVRHRVGPDPRIGGFDECGHFGRGWPVNGCVATLRLRVCWVKLDVPPPPKFSGRHTLFSLLEFEVTCLFGSSFSTPTRIIRRPCILLNKPIKNNQVQIKVLSRTCTDFRAQLSSHGLHPQTKWVCLAPTAEA